MKATKMISKAGKNVSKGGKKFMKGTKNAAVGTVKAVGTPITYACYGIAGTFAAVGAAIPHHAIY